MPFKFTIMVAGRVILNTIVDIVVNASLPKSPICFNVYPQKINEIKIAALVMVSIKINTLLYGKTVFLLYIISSYAFLTT